MEGTIVRVVADKGFGFIRGTDNVERFFHRSQLENHDWPPQQDARVTFEHVRAEKGPRAVNVRVQD